jgi:hypothetical protein
MKKKIRLTEGDLHRIIKRTINEAFEGYNEDQWGDDFDDGLNHTKPNPFKKHIHPQWQNVYVDNKNNCIIQQRGDQFRRIPRNQDEDVKLIKRRANWNRKFE